MVASGLSKDFAKMESPTDFLEAEKYSVIGEGEGAGFRYCAEARSVMVCAFFLGFFVPRAVSLVFARVFGSSII